jgi:hypothetical protein
MKIIILISGLFFYLLSFSQNTYQKHFQDKTLRFDYIHAGNSDTSEVFPVRYVEEKYWGGSKSNLIDTFRYGSYILEIRDSLSGDLLYSRGYSTLFDEWQTTSAAKKQKKAFQESICFPFPKRTIRLEIYERDKSQKFHLHFTTHVSPNHHYIEKKQVVSHDVESILSSGKPQEKIDIVFIPDGYTAEDLSKFLTDVEKFTNTMFSWRPFINYKNRFNIKAVLAPSEQSGTDIPGDSIWRKTQINTNFYTFDSERYLTTSDYWKVKDLAGLTAYDQIYILVNHKKYGGGGIYNYYCTTTTDHKDSDFVFMHEFGHGFAALADEYYTSQVSYEDYFDLGVEPYQANITTLKDFDSKWKDLIEEGTPIPTPATEEYKDKIGVFEGGGYVPKGIYRPTLDGTMKSRKINAFGPVNERAIIRMIEFYSKP